LSLRFGIAEIYVRKTTARQNGQGEVEILRMLGKLVKKKGCATVVFVGCCRFSKIISFNIFTHL
jgi:hypothetical protein